MQPCRSLKLSTCCSHPPQLMCYEGRRLRISLRHSYRLASTRERIRKGLSSPPARPTGSPPPPRAMRLGAEVLVTEEHKPEQRGLPEARDVLLHGQFSTLSSLLWVQRGRHFEMVSRYPSFGAPRIRIIVLWGVPLCWEMPTSCYYNTVYHFSLNHSSTIFTGRRTMPTKLRTCLLLYLLLCSPIILGHSLLSLSTRVGHEGEATRAQPSGSGLLLSWPTETRPI